MLVMTFDFLVLGTYYLYLTRYEWIAVVLAGTAIASFSALYYIF